MKRLYFVFLLSMLPVILFAQNKLVDERRLKSKADTINARIDSTIGVVGRKMDSTRVNGLLAGKENTIANGTTAQYWRGDKSWQTFNSTAIGLGNVSNNLQVNKADSGVYAGGYVTPSGLIAKGYLKTESDPIYTSSSWYTTTNNHSQWDFIVSRFVADSLLWFAKMDSVRANYLLGQKEPAITAGTTAQYWRGDKTWQTLNSSSVGLGNVTNTAQVTSVGAGTGLSSSGGTTPTISIAAGYYLPTSSSQTIWNSLPIYASVGAPDFPVYTVSDGTLHKILRGKFLYKTGMTYLIAIGLVKVQSSSYETYISVTIAEITNYESWQSGVTNSTSYVGMTATMNLQWSDVHSQLTDGSWYTWEINLFGECNGNTTSASQCIVLIQ